MKEATFAGFPPELFQFLTALAKNNNRTWFQDNKARYQRVALEPMARFITAMVAPLADISEHFSADARRHGGSMFRIYRDTRFSKDKRPYKKNVGCQFRHRVGKGAHAPGFYVHLQPGQVFIGGGIWKPNGTALTLIRAAIIDNPAAWKRATSGTYFEQHYDGLGGESLQRAPRGFSPDHPLIKDLRHKSFYVMQPIDEKMACSDQWMSTVEMAFKAASPLMEFITFALELPYSSRLQQRLPTDVKDSLFVERF